MSQGLPLLHACGDKHGIEIRLCIWIREMTAGYVRLVVREEFLRMVRCTTEVGRPRVE